MDRKWYALRWDLVNVKLLCASCHWWWHTVPLAAAEWFKSKYPARHAYLLSAERIGEYRNDDLAEKLEQLKTKLDEL
ncbi:MAG: hypothetical protein H7839_24340 [Magnetococcus sp. YQC-5]